MFGLFSVTAMLVYYALEDRTPGMSSDLPPPARWVRSTVSCKARGRLDLSRPSGPSSRYAGGGTDPRSLFRKVGSTTNEKHMLRDDINNALKDAMASDERRVSTLRLVNSSLKNADIEARGQGKGPLADDEVLPVLQKMIKQRQESITLDEQGGAMSSLSRSVTRSRLSLPICRSSSRTMRHGPPLRRRSPKRAPPP